MDAVTRARLLVRTAGLALAGVSLPWIPWAVFRMFVPASFGSDPSVRFRFFFWQVSIFDLGSWLREYGVPIGAFAIGAVLLWRGSRWIERRVADVLAGS